MTDTYLLPEVHIIITQVPGVDGIASPIRLTQIENDLATILGRPVINELADISDVDTAGSEGDALIKQSDGSFAFGTVSGAIDRIGNAGTAENSYGVSYISLRNGIEFAPSSAGTVFIQPVTGTTSGTLASGPHNHRLPAYERAEFGPTGYMSGGSRQLASQSIVLDNGIQYRIVARLKVQMRGSDPGAGYYQMTVQIEGGVARTSPGGSNGFWCVQGVPNKEGWVASGVRTGTGSAIDVTATVSYHSGAGFNVDAGELEVMAFARR